MAQGKHDTTASSSSRIDLKNSRLAPCSTLREDAPLLSTGGPCSICLSSPSPVNTDAGTSSTADSTQTCRCGWGYAGDKVRGGPSGGDSAAAACTISPQLSPPERNGILVAREPISICTLEGSTAGAGEAVVHFAHTSEISSEMVRATNGNSRSEDAAIACTAGVMSSGGTEGIIVGGVHHRVSHQQPLTDQASCHDSSNLVKCHAHPASESSEDKMVVDVGAEVERTTRAVSRQQDQALADQDSQHSQFVSSAPVSQEMVQPLTSEDERKSASGAMTVVVKSETFRDDGCSIPTTWLQSPPACTQPQYSHRVLESAVENACALAPGAPEAKHSLSTETGGGVSTLKSEATESNHGIGDFSLTEGDTMDRLAQSLAQVSRCSTSCFCPMSAWSGGLDYQNPPICSEDALTNWSSTRCGTFLRVFFAYLGSDCNRSCTTRTFTLLS